MLDTLIWIIIKIYSICNSPVIRRRLYGDPVYKQNLADIREREKRNKKGNSKISSYYVDKDRNIPISDVEDIKGKFMNR